MLQHLRFNEKDHLLSNVGDMIPHPLQLSDDRQQIQSLSNVVRIIANVIRNDPRSLAIDFIQDHILIKNGQALVSIDRKSTGLTSSHKCATRMPSSACIKQTS